MKILNKIWGIGLLAFMLMLSAPHKTFAQQEGEYISDQEFYDELQPYGTWINDPQYGNAWIPDVEEDFRPYATRGYWALTEYGNTWVSDYPWGWATFHYGRWHFDDYYGWEWIPGNEWAPAWVTWRDGGGYYGWAPMEPGVSIDASFADNYSVPDDYWIFTPYAYINYTNVYNYYAPHNRVSYIIKNTNWMRNRYTQNNHIYNAGPRREDIQRYSHRPVRVYNINNVSKPSRITVNKNNINIYRPAVRQNTNARPARVVDGAAYKQQNPAQRIGSSNRSKGTAYNAANAAKLAQAAKNNNPDSRFVRVNTNVDSRATAKPSIPAASPARPDDATRGNDNKPDRTHRPAVTSDVKQQRAIDKQQSVAQRQQIREQQQKAREQQTEQQKKQLERQGTQQQEARKQQRPNRPAVTDGAETQQKEQARQQAMQQRQQQQALEQQKQQQQQARDQQKQQQEQQRQQQAREQQKQQQAAQQQARKQQQEQQARQQQEQQRQQQQQQQVRQQQEQQRQQQQQQQQVRQQQEQQRQQQRQAPAHRPRSK